LPAPKENSPTGLNRKAGSLSKRFLRGLLDHTLWRSTKGLVVSFLSLRAVLRGYHQGFDFLPILNSGNTRWRGNGRQRGR
jgi:hypothetical protein